MDTCNECRDLLWEDLYGLLEAGERQQLRSHLEFCPACQEALGQVRKQQQLLAETARLDVDIPLFKPTTRTGQLEPVLLRPSFLSARWARVALSAAAALLLVLLPMGIYQQGRHLRELALNEGEDRLAAVVAQQEDARNQIQHRENELIQRIRADHLHVHVEGPANYRPEGFNRYRIATTTLDDQPKDVPVSARVVDVRTRQALFEQQLQSRNGALLLALPPNLPLTGEGSARIEIASGVGSVRAQLQAPLHVLDPALVSQLITDKQAYHPGETIFFESLTLNRQSFRPPGSARTLWYALAGPGKNVVAKIDGKSSADGAGAGHLALPADCPEGEYTLSVQSSADDFLPAKRSLLVRKGQLRRVTENAGELDVEFFPEGGSLVAGVPCRVYFLARTKAGQRAELAGQIVDGSGAPATAVKTAVPGLGMFALVAAEGKVYRLQVMGTGQRLATFALPIPERNGVTLAVSQAVLHAGEPIHLALHNQGPDRQMTVRVEHHGKLVAENRLAAHPGLNEIDVRPQVSGALHVSVYDVRSEELVPVADRLVYREPENRMAIEVRPDKQRYSIGETVTLRLQSRTNQGKPDPAWLTVAAVERGTAGGAASPATFDLAAELEHPEEIDDVLSSMATPDASAALELFLGTQSWHQSTSAGTSRLASGHGRDADMLRLDNAEQLRRATASEFQTQFAQARAAFASRSQALAAEGEGQRQEIRQAGIVLSDYQNRASRFAALTFWGCAGLALIFAVARFGSATRLRILGKNPGFALATAAAVLALVANFLILGRHQHTGPATESFQLSSAKQSALLAELTRPEPNLPGADLKILAPIRVKNDQAKPNQPPSSKSMNAEQPFVYHRPANVEKGPPPETIFWNPNLFTANGTAEVKFDLPMRPATYVVHIEAHDAEGRLAAFETTLECSANSK